MKAGELILDHDAQRLDLEDDVSEYRKQMEPDVIKGIQAIIKKSKDQDIYKNKDFYICFTFTTDRVLRQPKPIIWARRSCPTPVYKTTVFKYHHVSGQLEFLWTLPDMLLYHSILKNSLEFLQDKETQELTKFCMLLESGELLNWVKKENGDKPDGVIFINDIQ